MTAWAISVVDGDGTLPHTIRGPAPGQSRPQDRTEGPYRPRAGEYGTYVTLITSLPDGSPGKPWCLVRLGDDADLVAADADPGVVVLDDGDLDRVLGAAATNVVNTRLAAAGVVFRATVGMTVRQVLAGLCAELGDPTWAPIQA